MTRSALPDPWVCCAQEKVPCIPTNNRPLVLQYYLEVFRGSLPFALKFNDCSLQIRSAPRTHTSQLFISSSFLDQIRGCRDRPAHGQIRHDRRLKDEKGGAMLLQAHLVVFGRFLQSSMSSGSFGSTCGIQRSLLQSAEPVVAHHWVQQER